MRYLHFIQDRIFTDFTIQNFEESNPGNNVFVVEVDGGFDCKPQFTHTSLPGRTIYAENSLNNISDLFVDAETFDVVVFHNLIYHHVYKILKVPSDKVILWSAWGADIYNEHFCRHPLYMSETGQYLATHQKGRHFRQKLLGALREIKNKQLPYSVALKRAVRKIDFVSSPIPDEYNILKEIRGLKATYVQFRYESLETNFGAQFNQKFNPGNSIFIGNSAIPTSNHLDILKKLSQIDLGERKIIVPLSYGNHPRYKQEVINMGIMYFGESFVPLLNMMKKKDYITYIQQCGIAIQGHERQQGLGNIIIFLWTGAKIFLSENNYIYKYLKQNSFLVYSIQRDLTEDALNTLLSEDEKEYNRALSLAEFGLDSVKKKVQTLVKKLNQFAREKNK